MLEEQGHLHFDLKATEEKTDSLRQLGGRSESTPSQRYPNKVASTSPRPLLLTMPLPRPSIFKAPHYSYFQSSFYKSNPELSISCTKGFIIQLPYQKILLLIPRRLTIRYCIKKLGDYIGLHAFQVHSILKNLIVAIFTTIFSSR